MKNLILFSGGMDSTVLTYYVINNMNPSDSLVLLSVNYGSKHNNAELSNAKNIVDSIKKDFPHIDINHIIIDLDFNMLGISSGLLLSSEIQIPQGHYEDKSMKNTVVPFRNGILLSIAAAIVGCGEVYYGGHAGDHAIYPDCRPEFFASLQDAVAHGTDNAVALNAPFIEKTKREIALLGAELKAPLSMTWSCYNGIDTHCGKCGTCIERKEALYGFDDTIYSE